MPGPVTHTKYDMAIEEHGLRKQGMLGSGRNANTLFSIDYDSLPPEARTIIQRIIAGGPFVRPGKDGTEFENRFGDLPSGTYLEFTVPTPGLAPGKPGARRIVARKTTGQLFFTACHYERVGGGTAAARTAATTALDEAWRNGFYLVTGMTVELREQIRTAIKTRY